MLLPLIALAAIASAQGNDVHVQDAAQMHAAELLLRGDIRRLIAEAKSHDIGLQRAAIWALGQSGDVKFVPLLVDLALEPETKEEAIRALYFLGMRAYRALLKESLTGRRNRRLLVARILWSVVSNTHRPVGDEARALLWELRVSENPDIRRIAVMAARDLQGITVAPEEVAVFLDDPSPLIRQIATLFVRRTGDEALTRRVLRMASEDGAAGVRANILSNFAAFGGLTSNSLHREQFAAVFHGLADEAKVAREALRIVSRVAGPAGRRLARNAITDRPEDIKKIREVQALYGSDKLRYAVRHWTRSGDREMRWEALLASAAIQNPEAFDLLLAWKSEGPWERTLVLQAIGWTGDTRGLDYLSNVLVSPSLKADERAAIIKGFALLGSKEQIDAVIEFILDKSANPNDRTEVAHGMVEWDAHFTEAVNSVVMDATEHWIVRSNMLSLLPRLDIARAFDTAVAVLSRPGDKELYWRAVMVFERIGDPRAIPYIERALVGADEMLKRVGERALEALRRKV